MSVKLPTNHKHLAVICGLKGDVNGLLTLSELSYKADGNQYREWPLRQKGCGKVRYIQSPRPRLCYVQTRLYMELLSRLEVAEAAFGGVIGHDNIQNASIHTGNRFVFNTDIQNFYPTLNSSMVYRALLNVGFIPRIASIITKLTTYKGSVPTGAPTSSAIANIVMSEFDEIVSAHASKRDLQYTRFVDDIVLSGQYDFRHSGSVAFILESIRSFGLKYHNRKTCFLDLERNGSVLITGIDVSLECIQPSRAIRRLVKSGEYSTGLLGYIERIKQVDDDLWKR